MNSNYLVYFPLFNAIFSVVCGAIVYYVQRVPISTNSKLNKYKLSPKSILIKLKLFKYDNRFNYFLLIPYLFSWLLFFAVLILYIVYWCGIIQLESFFLCMWVNLSMALIPLGLMIYSAFMRELISCTNGLEKPDFKIDEKENAEKDFDKD